MGLRQSTRLNVTIGGLAPPPRVSTTGTTAVIATRGEVHGTTTRARAVPPKQSQALPSKAHDTKAMTQAMSLQAHRELNALPSRSQASHSRASCTEQPTLVAQLAPATQPAYVVSQAAQVGSRLSQPLGPIIEPGVFSPHFSADLTFPNSNIALRVYHYSTA
ncbi:hypothetical protein ACFX1Z_015070 [Malus domestica]